MGTISRSQRLRLVEPLGSNETSDDGEALETGRQLLSEVRKSSRQRGLALMAKRCVDMALAMTLLVVLSPALLLVAALIKLDSAGPVVFRQRRIGRGGEMFTILKFRSMAADADQEVHRRFVQQEGSEEALREHYKLQGDTRITRVGRVIRELSIDELPQLVNVLRGEMSLVGPRPDVLYSLFQYEAEHYRRFEVLPGLTGLWQVSGRSTLSYREMLDLDLLYLKQWSVSRDLVLLARTVPELLKQGRAG